MKQGFEVEEEAKQGLTTTLAKQPRNEILCRMDLVIGI
jgi:hypothetical protein